MSTSYTLELGTYHGRTYFLTVSVRPSFNDVGDFAVTVYYNAGRDGDENVQIARIDTSHGDVHFDRLYRRDQPKDFSIDMAYFDAEEHLRANWRRYAHSHERAHGSVG